MLDFLAHDSDRSVSASLSLTPVAPSLAGREPVLLQRFGAPETLDECVEIGDLRVHVVGLAVTLEGGDVVAGAAADLSASPFERAYFELLERLAIMEFGRVEAAGVGCQKWSSSSGVALHVGVAEARRRARLELIERDRVLRSWYGGPRPRIIEGVRHWPISIERHYRVAAYRFEPWGAGAGESAEVVGVVAFPRHGEVSLSMGFAARESLQEALDAAGRELLQQVAFGWGEPVPDELPEPSATPEFHLDFYGCSESHRLLQGWLTGDHEGRGPTLPEVRGDFAFTDITPSWMEGGLRVVRASHPSALPLAFGLGHPWFPELPDFMRVQPIA